MRNGLAKILLLRRYCRHHIRAVNKMEYGELTPLLFLTLPFLEARQFHVVDVTEKGIAESLHQAMGPLLPRLQMALRLHILQHVHLRGNEENLSLAELILSGFNCQEIMPEEGSGMGGKEYIAGNKKGWQPCGC